MSGNPPNPSKGQLALVKKYSVPILLTELFSRDSILATMKEGFTAEMSRIEEEMINFSTALKNIYGRSPTIQAAMTTANRENPVSLSSLDTISKSPLIQGVGDNKTLNLQFDLRDYDPHEVKVEIQNNTLIVGARHEQKTGSTALREFHREFLLPSGTNPEAVESTLTGDGVLTVRAPLNLQLLAQEAV